MANHKSAIKKYLRDEKKNFINRMNRSKMRNKIKLLNRKLEAGESEVVKSLFPAVISIIDKTVIKGTIHKKTASRYKSRVTLRVRKAGIQV
ncbi:MAG TPA: 30S ribosomal protein S20 [Candidatus Deferrimicrobium sp.]|nr:30S ribosomal protein S20 [Candidatus Kapabacteria bacterium]HLP58486.1 30S ribosomal protein S20 [Candidatus Deferrimicrobium sp.]